MVVRLINNYNTNTYVVCPDSDVIITTKFDQTLMFCQCPNNNIFMEEQCNVFDLMIAYSYLIIIVIGLSLSFEILQGTRMKMSLRLNYSTKSKLEYY